MNGKTARLFRKFTSWAGIRLADDLRARVRTWNAMSHRQKGQTRARIIAAMERDPKHLRGVAG